MLNFKLPNNKVGIGLVRTRPPEFLEQHNKQLNFVRNCYQKCVNY